MRFVSFRLVSHRAYIIPFRFVSFQTDPCLLDFVSFRFVSFRLTFGVCPGRDRGELGDYSTKWEFDDAEPGPMGKPIGEITHRRNKNVEDLPRQPKYTNPCPWRGPYKGNHKGGRPKAAPLCGGGRRPPPLYGPLHGHGFVYLGCLGRSSTFLLRLCVISPMGFPMGPGSASSNSHLVLYFSFHYLV